MKMNQSRYNVILPLGDEYILYNTLTSALTVIDEDIQNVLTTGEGPQDIVEALHQQGFLIDPHTDERDIVKSCLEEKRGQVPETGYRKSPLGKVEFLNLIITHQCNLNCTYCYKNATSCTGHMSTKVARKSVAFAHKEIDKNSIDTLFVSFYGGEPLVNLDVMEYIHKELHTLCHENGVTLTVKLFTNGTLLTNQFFETFSMSPIADVHITFDAPESLHHQRRVYPDGSSSFDAAVKGAVLTEDLGINLILRINISPGNLDVIPFLQRLREKGITHPDIYLGMAEPQMDYCTHYYSSYGFPGDTDVFCFLKNEAAQKGFELLPSGIGLHFSLCASTGEYFHIVDVDGSVYKCMSLVGDTDHAAATLNDDGTLTKTRVYSAWLSRNPLAIPQCSRCTLLPRCMGGCTAIAWRNHNTYNAPGCFTVDFAGQLYNSRPVQKYTASKAKD
jgi:uncharacterized protein